MLYLTCTTISSVNLAHYGVSRAKDWESVDCGTIVYFNPSTGQQHHHKTLMNENCCIVV